MKNVFLLASAASFLPDPLIVAGSVFGGQVIYGVSYGGLRFSIQDLNLWGSAWITVQTILPSGLLGLVFVPILTTITAWFPARITLREKPVDLLRDIGM